ncbi:MAG: Spermidine N(1)-acetyltransferase [candidate division WS2 bacterium]|nr:Spermidine N(1)-acetyltransferase [Candidatus Psychracetigena formicireducens]
MHQIGGDKVKLRRLAVKDLDKMLEWMKDPDISQSFRFDTNNISKDQVIDFINNSIDKRNVHLAIVCDADEYLGTISLKNIDGENSNAEYAISLRRKALGTEVAKKATDTILYIAFYEMGLNRVYLNVLSKNTRAVRFYEKYGFSFEGEFIDHLKIRGEYQSLKWFGKVKTIFVREKLKYLDQIASQYEKNILESRG